MGLKEQIELFLKEIDNPESVDLGNIARDLVPKLIYKTRQLEKENERLVQIINEDHIKTTIEKTFEHDGFTFEEGKKCYVEQDQYYITLTDDYGKEHAFTYNEAEKLGF